MQKAEQQIPPADPAEMVAKVMQAMPQQPQPIFHLHATEKPKPRKRSYTMRKNPDNSFSADVTDVPDEPQDAPQAQPA